tara:strand:- start:46 stop:666 length:621 start_codon:yes stop_codon:yes gene_type:complete
MIKKDALLYMQADLCDLRFFNLCCLELALTCRDFRMNILIRIVSSNLPIASSFCESLLFYLYGSTVSRNASLLAPIRFSHARSIVIGGNVCFSRCSFVYIFNNVTIGKASPAARDREMPTFKGSSFFGVGSVVLGSVVCEGDVVFGANSFISNTTVPCSSTVLGFGEVKKGVFFEDVRFPFIPLRPYRIAGLLNSILVKLASFVNP